MPSAPAAVLLQLDPVAVVMPVFGSDVVAVLAFTTLERHVDAPVTGHRSTSFGESSKAEPVYPAVIPGSGKELRLDGGAGGASRVRESPQEGRALRAPVHPWRRGERLDRIVLHRVVFLEDGPDPACPLPVHLGRRDVVLVDGGGDVVLGRDGWSCVPALEDAADL